MHLFKEDVATAVWDTWNRAGSPSFVFDWDKTGDFPSGTRVHPPVQCWQSAGGWRWVRLLGSSRVRKGCEKCGWTPVHLDSDLSSSTCPGSFFDADYVQIVLKGNFKLRKFPWDLVQGVRLFLIRNLITLFSTHISNLTQLFFLCTITSV